MSDDHDHDHNHDHNHDHDHGERRTVKHYVDDFFSNWNDYEGPIGRKLWLTAINRTRAYAPPFKGCCGHPGQPGC